MNITAKRVIDTPVHHVHFTLASPKCEMYTYAEVAVKQREFFFFQANMKIIILKGLNKHENQTRHCTS